MEEVKSNNKENSDIGLVFGQGISDDKWNPADIIAVLTNYDNKKEYNINQKPQGKLIESLQRLNDRGAKKKAEAIGDMSKLYEYNLWVDENYVKGNIVPISLKKATSIPKIEIYRQSKSDVFKSFLDMQVNVTKVEYKESNQKCIIHFDILTAKNALVAIRKANPKMIVKIWKGFIADKYRSQILAGDIGFFISKDQSTDVANASNSDKIMESIDRLREPVRNMGPENQSKVMKYIQKYKML